MAQKLLEGMMGARERVFALVSEANAIAERAVLGVVGCLAAVGDEARGHVERLQSLRAYSAEAGESGVHALVGRQSSTVAAYLRDMGELVGAQHAEANSTLAELDAMTHAARQIDQLADASRSLALNAQLEATHGGTAGKSFNVVALEMKRLAQAIQRANAGVADATASLQRQLSELTTHTGRLQAHATAMAQRLAHSLEDVAGSATALEATIGDALATGDTAFQAVLAQTNGALSQLQFQDPMAQQLLMIDRHAHAVVAELAAELQVMPSLREPPPASVSGDARIEQQVNGEVILF